MSDVNAVHPSRVQQISRGCFYIEIDGKWHQYSETAEVINGVTGEFKPPQWIIDHREKQTNSASWTVDEDTANRVKEQAYQILIAYNSMARSES